MVVISYMLLGICVSGIIGTIIWSIYQFKVIIPREIDKRMKEIAETEEKLNEKLVNLCSYFGIPLAYKQDLGTAGGIIYYHKDGRGRLMLDNARIEILEKYKQEPYVLAHELGHYIAIKKHQDNSEEAADQMAEELCRMFLSKQEQKDLEISLKCHFKRVA